MTSKGDYESGVRIRFGAKIGQVYTVRWNPSLLKFVCSCPAGLLKNEICWHRDIVVTKLAELALDQLPDVAAELEGKTIASGAGKRKILFNDERKTSGP